MTTRNPRRSSTHGFFVTGTDTGVGKTLIACALLHFYAQAGLRTVGMKPVAAGAENVEGVLRNEDVVALNAAANVAAPPELVNPYCFAEPIAPHIAAAKAAVTIDIDRIIRAYRSLSALADCVIVEGAGGFRVPLTRSADMGHLAASIGLPVIMVVGMRLGCLNHALLTAEAVRAAGLRLHAWVANHAAAQPMAYAKENIAALEERLDAPLLAQVAYDASMSASDIARRLDPACLR